MAGFRKQNYKTIVMDGSNEKVLGDILEGFRVAVSGRIKCGPLDNKHPTMMVIEARTSQKTYDSLQDVIENVYPGLCVFNPQI